MTTEADARRLAKIKAADLSPTGDLYFLRRLLDEAEAVARHDATQAHEAAILICGLQTDLREAEARHERRVAELFDAIPHGDDEHRAWLKQAIEDHFAGREVAKPAGMGKSEVRIKFLERQVDQLQAANTVEVERRRAAEKEAERLKLVTEQWRRVVSAIPNPEPPHD